MNDAEPSCKTCRFWVDDGFNADSGDCRINPPVIVVVDLLDDDDVMAMRAQTRFPNTDSTIWCGKWEGNQS